MKFRRLALCTAVGLAILFVRGDSDAPEQTQRVRHLIQRAGNTEDDLERLRILRQLQCLPGLGYQLREDVDNMICVADQWATSKYLPFFHEDPNTRDFTFGVGNRSPLYPLACFYRGRMFVWRVICGATGQRRRNLLKMAHSDLRIAQRNFPRNRIAGMYLGEPIPWDRELPGSSRAPEWAALQRENLERLADIVHWWIDNRMQVDGQFGGGWSDDCEMWRWWVPVLIAFQDPKIEDAQLRFSEALMRQPSMQGGYSSYVTDVQHAAEPSADAITPMLHIDPDSLTWQIRALHLVERMTTVWTGTNKRGQLQFKSTFFSSLTVDPNPQRACDTVYHPRAVQPALLLWQRTRDPRLTEVFSSWMNTWVDAAARVERGKPAGVLPSAIHWPDGRVGGIGEDWWDPRNYRRGALYRWPSAMHLMTDALLLTYHVTGDEKYLTPLRSMAALRLQWLKGCSAVAKQEATGSPKVGSESWCAERLGVLTGTLAKYKLLTRSCEFDELLAREGYQSAFDGADNRASIVASLRRGAEALRVNFEGYTSEVRYTDRVLHFPRLFTASKESGSASPAIRSPNTGLLYSLATGDPGNNRCFPLAAVRWLTPPRDIAAMVTLRRRNRFTAELYHFGTSPRPMQAELYLLAPGQYEFVLTDVEGDPLSLPVPFSVSGPRNRIQFDLPSQQICLLQVTPLAR